MRYLILNKINCLIRSDLISKYTNIQSINFKINSDYIYSNPSRSITITMHDGTEFQFTSIFDIFALHYISSDNPGKNQKACDDLIDFIGSTINDACQSCCFRHQKTLINSCDKFYKTSKKPD